MAILSLLGVASFVVLDHSAALLRAVGFTLLTGGSALVLRKPGTLPLVGHVLIGGASAMIFYSVWRFGVLSSMLPILPLFGPVAMFTGGRRSGLFWSASSLGILFVALTRSPLDEVAIELALFICSLASVSFSAWITSVFWSVTRAQAERLQTINVALRNEQQVSLDASQAKTTFLTTMSHEIRTPLNAVIGLSEMLSLQAVAPESRSTAQQIQRSGGLLLGLVNNVLDISRIESGELSLSTEAFQIRTLCEDVRDLFSVSAAGCGVALLLEADHTDRLLIGDRQRLQQVLTNLVGNALKFTDHGTITITMQTAADGPRHQRLTLSVQDTGVGIPQPDQARIFAAFAQVEEGLGRTYGGSGLGLAISSRLMALMGGTLALAWSERGKGSRFVATARLLVAEADTPVVEVPDTIPPGARVLIVEDETVNRQVVSLMLESLGCDCEVAVNGAEALDKVAAMTPDVIIMDQQMPVMDGLTATRVLRSRGVTTPIIALTANVFAEDRRMCLSAGMDDFLTKPISLHLLRQTLSTHLSPSGDELPAG